MEHLEQSLTNVHVTCFSWLLQTLLFLFVFFSISNKRRVCDTVKGADWLTSIEFPSFCSIALNDDKLFSDFQVNKLFNEYLDISAEIPDVFKRYVKTFSVPVMSQQNSDDWNFISSTRACFNNETYKININKRFEF